MAQAPVQDDPDIPIETPSWVVRARSRLVGEKNKEDLAFFNKLYRVLCIYKDVCTEWRDAPFLYGVASHAAYVVFEMEYAMLQFGLTKKTERVELVLREQFANRPAFKLDAMTEGVRAKNVTTNYIKERRERQKSIVASVWSECLQTMTLTESAA
jgi:hypothetical protein